MKAYSLDLRERVVQAYLDDEGSQRELAERFKVSPDFVYRLMKRYRETGTVAPAPSRAVQAAKIDEEGLQVLALLMQDAPDASLKTLCEGYEATTGVAVSVATMCRARQKVRDEIHARGSTGLAA